MDLYSELKENIRQREDDEISEDVYNERRKLILKKWTGEPKKTKQLEHCLVVSNKPKESNLYAILQLTPRATEAEIKSKYKKLALIHHPDKNGGIETEEWTKLSKAYQILSNKNSRTLYDNYGTVSNIFSSRASFNIYVGGDSWKPYIGDLDIGFRLFSFMGNENSVELRHITSAKQKEDRHVIRVSNIVRYLKDKLSRFPEKDNISDHNFFLHSLCQEAQKLSLEPNGMELLSLLGEIYVSEANALLNKSFMNPIAGVFSDFLSSRSIRNLILLYELMMIKTKSGLLEQEEPGNFHDKKYLLLHAKPVKEPLMIRNMNVISPIHCIPWARCG